MKGHGGKGPTVEDSIELDGRDIGRIIGRGGCNIKELQAGSGCSINVPRKPDDDDEDNAPRPVRLRGTKESVARVKDAINGVLMGSEPGDVFAEIDGAVLLKNVDPMSLSALVKMKDDLETKHSVQIELEARSCRIWAQSRELGVKCKEAIEEALEDLTTVNTVSIPVPANIVNQVINDTALRQLQDSSGMTANVGKDDQGTAIRLTGLQGVLDEATRLIKQLCGGEGADFLALMPGLITDCYGTKRQDLDRDFHMCAQKNGATLDVQPARVNFSGDKDSVNACRSELQMMLKFYFPENCDAIPVPLRSVDYIAGEDDRELMRLQSGGCVVSLDRKNASIWICGNARAVENARNRIKNTLERWEKTNQSMTLSHKGQAYAIIGHGGATIRNIQSATGAKVDVDTTNLTVMISGKTEDMVRQAQLRVQQALDGEGQEGGAQQRRGNRW
eukprot:GEMP01045835.1.p1 GENE.GEMP01045835.1~~GEMP01045835.1.p1  ORF type:complete len:447 (+),score=117.93 GEMP01045835.1:80-1420(+)